MKFLRLFLVWISLIGLLTGCYTSRFQKLSSYEFNREEAVPAAAFKLPEKTMFKTRMTAYGHELSGIMMFKKSDIDGLYVSFFNQLGMQFFNIELLPLPGGKLVMRVHHINELLDYNKLKDVLERDFNLMFSKPVLPYIEAKKYFDEVSALIYLKEKSHLGNLLYGFDPVSESIKQNMLLGGWFKKPRAIIDFEGLSGLPHTIKIDNRDIPVSLHLSRIEQQ